LVHVGLFGRGQGEISLLAQHIQVSRWLNINEQLLARDPADQLRARDPADQLRAR